MKNQEKAEAVNKELVKLTDKEMQDVAGGDSGLSLQNDIKYDAVGLGNHEFEFEITPLLPKR